ncbi:hypothetical protein BSL78_20658 [Apostichopus japonicus]|uniref:Uncharacterized protein n=1 Tax=Stichopus japonicus TaxID=307972 RepID=A0A2G8K3A3_STIJA|nr:hypothetical protein BSL78_20658 [Apostichopus japonicus]
MRSSSWESLLFQSFLVGSVKNTQALHASQFTTQRLKVQLRTRFHNLVFVKPSKRFESEIVYAKDINVDKIVDRVAEQFQTPASECNTTTSDESDARTTNATADDHTRLRTLYHASQIIRSILQNTTSAHRWPPTADGLTIDAARNIVPVPLFNFLTWCVGFSDEAELTDQVCISEDNNQRILSLAQNLLYTSVQDCFSTLVWDNNDFGEETISGKRTTHNTLNGILIQRNQPMIQKHEVPDSIPKSRRSINPPDSDITPYFGAMKKGGIDVHIKDETYHPAQDEAYNLDVTFNLSWLPHHNESLLPTRGEKHAFKSPFSVCNCDLNSAFHACFRYVSIPETSD